MPVGNVCFGDRPGGECLQVLKNCSTEPKSLESCYPVVSSKGRADSELQLPSLRCTSRVIGPEHCCPTETITISRTNQPALRYF